MNNILYICIWIVGISSPAKAETRTPFPDTFVRDYIKTGNMKEIQLTKGKVTLVDDDDFDFLMQWKWFASLNNGTYYVMRRQWIQGMNTSRPVYMHRVIMKTPKGITVDHIDHNSMNNQKYNLRNCTQEENTYNAIHKKGITGFIGVGFDKRRNKFVATIRIKGHRHYLGQYSNPIVAAKIYDRAARKNRGEFAVLNFPMDKG